MSLIKNKMFTISDNVLKRCSDFAKESVGTSADKYARRNQSNIAKITKDITIGKVGEEYVWKILSDIYPNLSTPDYNIYDKKQKNWDPDLKDIDSGLKIAVKCQDIQSEINYGRSWVFQYNSGKKFDCDTGVFEKHDNNHYVCFVSLNTPKRCGELQAIVKISWLHDNNLFQPMKMKNLQGNKLAVYFDDLKKIEDELWQL